MRVHFFDDADTVPFPFPLEIQFFHEYRYVLCANRDLKGRLRK